MNVRQKINEGRARLAAAGIDNGEAGRDANLFARHLLGWDRPMLMVRETDEAGPNFSARFDAMIERRARREPAAYIRGIQEFWDRNFDVTPAALIPRPETELIIEELLKCVPQDLPTRPQRLADVGTGTGCLAITAALELPNLSVFATDISQPALELAKLNAKHHGVSDRISFVETPFLSGTTGTFDFILSNPPYVTAGEYQNLMPEVRDYEPASALVAGDDGLRDVRELVRVAPERLTPGGTMFMEIGHQHADAVADLVGGYSSLTLKRIAPDLQRIPRVAIIERNIT
jgi:release factor glutamine methyltransferase